MLIKGWLAEMKWRMAANVFRVSFGDNENVKLIVVMAAQLCGHTKSH